MGGSGGSPGRWVSPPLPGQVFGGGAVAMADDEFEVLEYLESFCNFISARLILEHSKFSGARTVGFLALSGLEAN